MNLELINKVVLITGSGRGLGKGIAETFLQEGAKVVLSDIDMAILTQTREEFLSKYDEGKILICHRDLTKEKDIRSCVEKSIKHFGIIDILIANLGSGISVNDWNPPDEEWEKVMTLNFHGARKITENVVPLMINQNEGSIVYISSIAGKEVIGAPIPYSVAKTSLISYAKNLSYKLAENNIRINTVCPGNILFENGTWDEKLKKDAQNVKQMLDKNVPMKRFSTPEEISNIVVFVSSNKASFITGSCIIADGGQTKSI